MQAAQAETNEPALREDILAYDTETTGINVRLDQVLQFAAVRALPDGTPISGSDMRVRRLPYVIPSPKALSVTGIDPRTLDDPGLPSEFEAAETVLRTVAPPAGTVRTVVTFNGHRYDNEMLRTMFFRNLLDPYFSDSARSMRHLDVMSACRLAVAMDPGCIATVEREEGDKASMRLSDLCGANGIAIEAHDALEDVHGTLAMMRLVRDRSPAAWTVARRAGSAKSVDDNLARAQEQRVPAWLFTNYKAPDCRPYLVLRRLGGKRWLCVDLTAEVQDVKDALADIGKSLYDPSSPLREIKANKSPYLLSGDEACVFAPGKDGDGRWLDADRARFKASALAGGLAGLAFGPVPAYVPDVADPTAEEGIYDGFTESDDKHRMRLFRRMTDWKDRSDLSFDDPRIADFAARILVMTAGPGEAKRHPNKLETLRRTCAEAMARPFAAGTRRWTTLDEANAKGDKAFRRWASGIKRPDAGPAQMSFGF